MGIHLHNLKGKSKPGPIGAAGKLMLQALERGPCCLNLLSVRAGVCYQAAGMNIKSLLLSKRVIVCGTAGDALAVGRTDVMFDGPPTKYTRHDAKVYALAGTPVFPKAPKKEPVSEKKKQAGPEIAGGEFAIAGPKTIPQYRWHGAQFRGSQG